LRFENTFDVDAPLDEVWRTVLDVERVAPNVPGAQVLEQTGEDAYKVAIKVKVGPMSMTYRGEVQITERDDEAHRAVMKARAKESRGQGTADADVTMLLTGDQGRTSATVTTEVQLSGKVATLGQGVLQDVSGRLVETFAHNLAGMLEGHVTDGAAAPASAVAGVQAAAATVQTQPSGASPPVPDAPRGPVAAPDPTPAPAPAPGVRVDALDLGSIGGAVVADRLRDPRRLGALVAFVAALFFALGRRSRGR
jgi:carbon monoxide dehydrogenase subunit G